MDSRSKNTLLEIEQNALKYLHIGAHRLSSDGEHSSADDYDRLGTAIESNTHLTKLQIGNLSDNVTLDTTNRRFYDGIRHNSSITELYLHSITPQPQSNIRYNSIADAALETLKACQEKNILTKLHINTMPLMSSAEENRFVESLRYLTNLRDITFIRSDITDEQLLPMVEAIRGYNLIDYLHLGYNRIGNAGCEALSTLRNVTKVILGNNNIGNEGMVSFANSLFENNNLRELIIYNNNPFDLRNVEDEFCRALCNTSSINDIYSSNHTLETIHIQQDKGDKLNSLLAMNASTKNKRCVAIKKILLYHPHNFDMEPLFDLSLEEDDSGQDLKALPHVISWFKTAREAIRTYYNGGNMFVNDLKRRKLSAIYQFVNTMPMLFIPASHDKGGDKKRKRSIN